MPTPRRTTNELTAREIDVMEQLAKGLSNKHIAHELGLSEHTVKVHIARIQDKMGTTNRTAAALLYRGVSVGERPPVVPGHTLVPNHLLNTLLCLVRDHVEAGERCKTLVYQINDLMNIPNEMEIIDVEISTAAH